MLVNTMPSDYFVFKDDLMFAAFRNEDSMYKFFTYHNNSKPVITKKKFTDKFANKDSYEWKFNGSLWSIRV